MSAVTDVPSDSNPLLALLDFVPSPIVLFNADGLAVFSNQAARQLSCRPDLLLALDPHVRGLVRDVVAGKAMPNLDAVVDNGTARLQCRCAPQPIAGLVVMAVTESAPAPAGSDPKNPPPGAAQRPSLQQIMELIRADLMPPIQQVMVQASPTEHRGLVHSLALLSERLERLSDLVNAFGDDVLSGDESLLVPDMVKDIARDLAPLAQSMGVNLVIEGGCGDLPPVCGSRRLLHRALYECLHHAVRRAREGVRSTEGAAIAIRFRSEGGHLMVHIRHVGLLSAAALAQQAAAIFQTGDGVHANPTDQAERLHIGLPMTQRILQLHGGCLRFKQDNAHNLDVLLELPIGAPLRSTYPQDLFQTQIDAVDLSGLVASTDRQRTA